MRMEEEEETETKAMKQLSSIANSLLHTCSKILDTPVTAMVDSLETGLKNNGTTNYSRELVEFCSSMALGILCPCLMEKLSDGYFTALTFDMMLAWETPSSSDEDAYTECVGKEKEEKGVPLQLSDPHEDIPLFYSDIMPLLVDEERNVGEDAFLWLVSCLPLPADVVNARFVFETLTISTANRLHFPAYDKYLKDIDRLVGYLQTQTFPKGAVFAEDEFIVHAEGTATTNRVIRHIGDRSLPGRLTLTNYALYFEASCIISYEDALKIDLSKADIDHKLTAASTGPLGAPLFDKAIVYESSLMPDGVTLEFPEITSSTRRDHWLALTREIVLLHQFISTFNIEASIQRWETHARVILGIIRLHAVREMLKISPPLPSNFLIFMLLEQLPRGDSVMEELANEVKQGRLVSPCSATSILMGLHFSQPKLIVEELPDDQPSYHVESTDMKPASKTPLEKAVDSVRQEADEMRIAKSSVNSLKEEGIAESLMVFKAVLSPIRDRLTSFIGQILSWERPLTTIAVLVIFTLVVYKEWVRYVLSALLAYTAVLLVRWKRNGLKDEYNEIVINPDEEQSTVETVVSAQHALNRFRSIMFSTNISLLKIHSIVVSRAEKHANAVILSLAILAAAFLLVPFKAVLIAWCVLFVISKSRIGKAILYDPRFERRMREWWDSIPITPVRTLIDE